MSSSRGVLAVVLLLPLVLALACDQRSSAQQPTPPPMLSSGTPALPAGRHTPAALDPDAESFLQLSFVGQRPFLTVEQYAEWLANRPGTERVAVSTTPQADGGTRGSISVEGSDGSVRTGGCAFGGPQGSPHDLLWYRCPELAALWTAGSPLAFPSLQAARHFLPFDVMLPESLPGGYRLTQVTLPGASLDPFNNLFVVMGVYDNGAGVHVEVEEQPAGLNGPIFSDFSSCRAQRTRPIPGARLPIVFGTTSAGNQAAESCAAWAHKAIDFFLASTAAGTPLDEIVQAIEGS